MRVNVTVILLLLFCFGFANSQNNPVEQIFTAIYNQNYQLADSLLLENRSDIDPFYFTVLEIDLSYWKNVTGTTNPDYKAFEFTLQQYQSQSTETHHQKVIQLISLSYQLRYELKRFKIFDAISTRKKTKVLFSELKKYHEQLPEEHHELFELYNSLFLYFDNYLKPFFISDKKENCSTALATMQQLTQSDNKLTKTLTYYFLGKTLLKYEKKPQKAISYFQWLTINYPNNKSFSNLLQKCKNQLN